MSDAETAMLDSEQEAIIKERDLLVEWAASLRETLTLDPAGKEVALRDKLAEFDETIAWLNRRIDFNERLDEAAADRDLVNEALTDAAIDRLRSDMVSIADQVSSRIHDALPATLTTLAGRPRFILAWAWLAEHDPFGVVPRIAIDRNPDGFDPPVVSLER